MVFSSLIFLFAYLPITLAVYYLSPLKWRNGILFAVSLVFYGWGEPKYIGIMIATVCIAYAMGFGIEKHRQTKPMRAKLWLGLSIGANLAFLLFFKYYNFFASMLGLETIEGLTLPVGISFYTFQIMSYSIDLYRGEVPLAKSFVPFGTYVTLFPQLIAGPIVRYRDVWDQLRERRENLSDFAAGVERFTLGLSKKLLLGDAAAAAAKLFETSAEFSPTAAGAWLIMLFYSFHIYFDFSGYSDMAVGLGKMFGFHFTENFRYPYMADSITDFWHRWHITLSTWFKEYVYIPLGGNRRGSLCQVRNMVIVWFLTGFWHGADWNFILWGLYFCLFLVMEKLFLLKLFRKRRGVSHLYALLVVGFGWLIFFYSDLGRLWDTAKHLVGVGAAFADPTLWYDVLHLLPLVLICALGCTPLPKRWLTGLKERSRLVQAMCPIGTCVLLILCVAYMVAGSFSPFLYFIF